MMIFTLFLLQAFLSLVWGKLPATPGEDPKQRALDMLAKMNLTEKMTMMSGLADYDYLYTGTIQGIDRVGIPTIHMEDGPQGFRCEDPANYGTTTAWPSAMTIAAAWDQDLLAKWGKAMSDEFKYKGASIILGPGVGVARVPTGGRNFEYLCGEDPSFCSLLVPSLIKSIQDNGIIANAKHFVNNEIEKDRQQMSSNVGERARFEIYYPPFEAAADAGVLSVMCSYNRVNDVYACENSETLNHLRENLGFDGWVMSDWWATMSTGKAIKAGLDQEMPYGYWYQFSNMTAALESGEINEADIDRSVTRILTAMYAIGVFDRPAVGDRKANVTSDAHNQLAREIAAKSTVLLQNKNYLLPLNKNSLGKCVAVFGDEDTVHGGGSGSVEGPYIITPKMGLVNALAGTQTEVIYSDGKDLAAAKDLAASCETAVVVVATNSGEGDDRANLSLDGNYDSLVSTVAAVNPRTIVSVRTPGAVLMPWANEVGAILVSWLGGQEAGNGLADVLFGKVNPYARLHVSMPNKENEVGFTPEQYPGVGNPPEASYSEELLIGYRWYEANGVTPRFPFGHGLSYTTFNYEKIEMRQHPNPVGSDDKAAIAEVIVTVTNTGSVSGSEVVQLYVQYPSAAGEPPKQLRSFGKVDLRAKQSQSVVLPIRKRDISIWNAESHAWEVVPGDYKLMVGSSSAKIRLSTTLSWNA